MGKIFYWNDCTKENMIWEQIGENFIPVVAVLCEKNAFTRVHVLF